MRPELAYQVFTLITIVLIIDLLERFKPGFRIKRLRDLPLNLWAMAFVIIMGEQSKKIVLAMFGFFNVGAPGSMRILAALPGAVKIPLAVVLTDFALYWVHRAMHTKLLWPTQRFHHSIGEIWWLSGARTSFTHLCLFAAPQLFIAQYLLRLSALQFGIALSFGVVVNVWLHANIWVDLGFVEKVFITPNYHRIHHGAGSLSKHNLGFIFTVWDRMFGTYLSPQSTGRAFPMHAEPTANRLLRLLIGF